MIKYTLLRPTVLFLSQVRGAQQCVRLSISPRIYEYIPRYQKIE